MMALTKTQELLQMKDQIAQLTAINDEQAARITKLEAELKSANSSKDTWYNCHNTSERKLAEIINFIDELPNIIPELKEDGYTRVPALVRLAVWIATQKSNLKEIK